jgi:hypothetical protein
MSGGKAALFPLAFAVPALVALGQVVAPQSRLYQADPAPSPATLVIGLSKLMLLALAAAFSWFNGRRLEGSDAGISRSWRVLSLGWMAYLLGQLTLAWFQLVRGVDAPYPSPGDLFFLAAYPLFMAALFGFVRAYRAAGFGVGSGAQQGRLAGAVALGCAAVAVPLLRPTVVAPTPALETALNVAYPAMDLMLVVPGILMLRMAMALRGGAVARVWLAVLAGFAFMCAGDVLFGYFSALGYKGLDPYVHATYILSYGLVAEGARRQHALLAG